MPNPLQKTKLFIPPAREMQVDRPRLIDRLDGLCAEGSRAALISAPAGSGKTTLVVQWLAHIGWPAGWLSLDARDNTPTRFFAYLIAALREALPGEGSAMFNDVLALLNIPGARNEEIVTLLTNDMTEVTGSFILVLDDFHTVSNLQLHQALDLLLEAQPPNMRLVLLTREDPAMQLSRRRARAQLVELRQEDLRFTLQEAVAFLNHSMGLRLSTEQVQALESRTEGWVAGLQMAALALHSAPDVDRFLKDFSGSHRFILDYLVEEVLNHQPAELQSFLIETSILERLCAGLCAAVIGKTSAQAQNLLEHLSKANLFVIPLDEERRWYRYHHLFRDLLLSRLNIEDPNRMRELQQSASTWYEANGEPRLAVEYALKAGSPDRAADLIEWHITERWQTADLEFHKMINRLPFEVIAERPLLCLQNAWLFVLFGQIERILPLIEAAERALSNQDRQPARTDDASLAFARTMRAHLADYNNLPVKLDESLELAYASIPVENVGMRNSVAVVIGTICFMEGDFAAAIHYFEDALALDKRVNGTNAVPIATIRIAFVLQTQGHLREALQRLSQSEAYVRERGSRRFYISGAINLLIGDILLEWNRLDEAEDQIREGLRLMADWPIPQVRGLGLALLARLNTARGALPEANAALEQALSLQQTPFHPIFSNYIERARLSLFILEQNWPALEAWVRQIEQQMQQYLAGDELPFRYESRLIELCRAWLAMGRSEDAASLLERMAQAAQGRGGSRLKILVLLAVARSQSANSFAALEEALRLAEPEGYLRTFLEMGEPLRQMLLLLKRKQLIEEPRQAAYVQQVLAAFDGAEDLAVLPFSHPPGLPEQLSQREQEVLLLVAKGLTNQQIADRLVISIRTVKKHVENINGKLGVQNRTQAAARARELGLLN
jgi:LuxR family transcriptional regulator, maltose regulon positive regulatory protein